MNVEEKKGSVGGDEIGYFSGLPTLHYNTATFHFIFTSAGFVVIRRKGKQIQVVQLVNNSFWNLLNFQRITLLSNYLLLSELGQ